MPFAQELQFDLYDYDPHGMNGQPTTVSPIPDSFLTENPFPSSTSQSHWIGMLSLTWI